MTQILVAVLVFFASVFLWCVLFPPVENFLRGALGGNNPDVGKRFDGSAKPAKAWHAGRRLRHILRPVKQ